MTYGQQRILAIAVAVCLLVIGAIVAGDHDLLGVSPRMVAWLAIVAIGLGGVQSFLPDVTGKASQPEHIANRIMELNAAERTELINTVAAKHAAEEASGGRG